VHPSGYRHDDHTRPDTIHQVVLGDKLSRRLGRDFDDLKRSTTNQYGYPKAPKLTASEVNPAFI
jgi:hypothetical protein